MIPGLQRQSSVIPASADPEIRAVRAETALEALKVKFQGATKEYEEVSSVLLSANSVTAPSMPCLTMGLPVLLSYSSLANAICVALLAACILLTAQQSDSMLQMYTLPTHKLTWSDDADHPRAQC